MGPIAAAVAYAAFLWWVSTGLILFLNHLSERTFPRSMAAASVVALAALAGIHFTASIPSAAGATWAFSCGVLVWGWHEMAFFMGYVTGPRRTAGPPTQGFRRFRQATETCIHHELAILLTAGVIFALTAGAPNHVALWTFVSLWLMRLSAKFNVFLGVRNLNEQFLPRRLAYLAAFMRHRRMNALLPFSLAAGATAATLFAIAATKATTGYAITGHALVATLLALAVIEHAVMVLPIPFEALWANFRTCPADAVRREGLHLPEPPALIPCGPRPTCPIHRS